MILSLSTTLFKPYWYQVSMSVTIPLNQAQNVCIGMELRINDEVEKRNVNTIDRWIIGTISNMTESNGNMILEICNIRQFSS